MDIPQGETPAQFEERMRRGGRVTPDLVRADRVQRIITAMRLAQLDENGALVHLRNWRHTSPPKNRRKAEGIVERLDVRAEREAFAATDRRLTEDEIAHIMRCVFAKRRPR